MALCASSFNLKEFWDWVEGVTFIPIPTTPCVEGGGGGGGGGGLHGELPPSSM